MLGITEKDSQFCCVALFPLMTKNVMYVNEMGQSQGELGARRSKGLVAFTFMCLTHETHFSQDTHTSGCAVLSLLLPAAATSAAAGADPPSHLSGAVAWPVMVLLKRRMLICSSSLSTTGVVGYCLVRP